jgi:hypothetical protein
VSVARRGPPSPAGPRRGETVQEWYFGLDGPARYRVRLDDPDWRDPITVWAMSPGEALDGAVIYVDSSERINVRGAPAHVEEIARTPDPDDLKATDEGWPFQAPPRPPRFDRQDIADAAIFVAILAVAGAIVGLYAFALLAALDAEWLRAAVAAIIATIPAAGLAALWLRA